MSAVTTGQVERLNIDPRQLLTDINIRLDARLDKDFVSSIKNLGVLQPVTVVRTTDGAFRVRFGHRRTAAAIEAGLDTIPVDVIGDEGSDNTAQIERVITQHAENAHRSGLTTADELNVVSQLSAFGLSASQINKRTRIKRTSVDAALTASTSDLAKAATERYDFLSLDQAAAVAEFEDDEDSVKALILAAQQGRFDHVVQRLRDEKQDEQAQQIVRDQLAEAGVTVIDDPGWSTPVKVLSSISTDDNPITVESHSNCPGHAAYLTEVWTDEDEDDETSDIDTDDSGDDENSNDVESELIWVPVYVCVDPIANGHIEHRSTRRGRTVEESEVDEEAQREERRRVIANNKAWRSAEVVRREWLTKFLERKTAPKNAQRFIFIALAQGDSELTRTMSEGHAFVANMVGIELETNTYRIDPTPIVTAISDATDGRAVMIALGLVLGAYEFGTHSNNWRYRQGSVKTYLEALEGWGYVLSDVEQLAAGREVVEVAS